MPNLVVLFGPPASGKAAIGYQLAERLNYRFFHNHLTANPVAALFGWTTPKFGEVVDEVRELLFRKAAVDPSIPGIVFTFVWAFDVPEDTAMMIKVKSLFEASAGEVYFVELLASLEQRMAREGTPFRAKHKPNQEDVQAARDRQVQFASQFKMNTDGQLPFTGRHIILDTEKVTPDQAAAEIQRAFGLSRGEA